MSSRDDNDNAVTKGAFLKEKFNNLARWVHGEVGQENVSADVIAGIAGRSELEFCMVAEILQANKSVSIHRDWKGMMQLLKDNKLPAELLTVLTQIRHKEAMHDKFWRYISLFIEVAEAQ